jgi:molybdopterin/thiamine biosynthesis adenylyltransferase
VTFGEQVERYVDQVGGVRTLSFEHLRILASEAGITMREAEIVVLELGILPRRYLRNAGTVGVQGQLALLQSSVAVVGLGGLGGYVVEGLARMGIGRLVLLDGDVFCDHNLNRQVLSSEPLLGVSKATVAGERVRQINRATQVECLAELATPENLLPLLSGVDVLVDAVDRLPTRMMLQDVAAQANVPMVHGAIAGWMGQVMVILPGDRGLRALYGDGPLPAQGAEAELGCPAASPMMVAAWQVHETVKILLGMGDLLQGRMLFIDASTADVRILQTE